MRQAESIDIPAIKVLGWMAFQESQYRDLTPDFELLHKLLNNSDAYNLWVAEEEDGSLCGFLLAHLQRGLFFKEIIATNTIYYVTPGKRGTNLPFRMLRELEKWAILNNASQLHIMTTGGTRTTQTMQMLERLGHTIVGVNTTKVLFDGQCRLRSAGDDSGREASPGATASDERAPAQSDGRAARGPG